TDTLDLSVLGLTGVADTSFNTLDYEVSTIVRNTGVDASGTISISFSMVDMAFSYFKADLKTYDFDSLAENISLGLPQSEFPDNIGFSNPQFRINVTNSTGVTTGLRISEISVKMADSSTQIITGTFDDNPFITDPAPNPGEVVTSQFEINNQNTDNLISLLNNIPSSVLFKGLTTMNPNGTPASLNFITDSSKISMSAQLVIPMEGYANNYQLKDTVNANLNIGDNGFITLDEINLRLQVENAFPFGLGLQVYFLDSLDNTLILDSLFSSAESQQVFPAAQVDGTGLVTSPTIQVTNVTMAIEKYERVRNAGSMVIVASLSTPGANDIPRKSVKITTSNYFTIGMGLSAHALIDPNTPN
ncbi:MAG: hypothetical protein OEY56_12550, partial [Cyclobacteriaceae bacterium]|nr:hypothetical protein [Cyclobacteriaceae bacterium]